MQQYPLDFVQVDYSIANRDAAASILPLAHRAPDRRARKCPARRRGGQSRPQHLRPARCRRGLVGHLGIGSWAQFMLKYAVAHPAVTCAIPGSTNPQHLDGTPAGGAVRCLTRPHASGWNSTGTRPEGRRMTYTAFRRFCGTADTGVDRRTGAGAPGCPGMPPGTSGHAPGMPPGMPMMPGGGPPMMPSGPPAKAALFIENGVEAGAKEYAPGRYRVTSSPVRTGSSSRVRRSRAVTTLSPAWPSPERSRWSR